MRDLDDALVMAGAAIVVDRRGNVVGWNEGAETLLGYTATEVVGRSCHHVICGRNPDGGFVCHPWCAMAPAPQSDVPGDELVLYPRTARRDVLRVVLSVLRVEGNDPTRGFVVHVITGAQLMPVETQAVSPRRVPWPPPRRPRKPRPPDTSQH